MDNDTEKVKSFDSHLKKEDKTEETKDEKTTEEQVEEKEEKKTEEEKTEEALKEESKEKMVPLAALHEEREKRQRLQGQIDALTAQAKPAQTVDTVDRDLNPGEYADQRINDLSLGVQNKMFQMSETIARSSHEDYDEVFKIGHDHLQENKTLISAYLTDSHPAEKVYQLGKELKFKTDYGTTPDDWRAKVKEEAKAEILKELEDEKKQRKKAKDKQPTDILKQRAASGDTEAGFQPKSFGQARNDLMSKQRAR